jgi:hypothetical protein
VTGVASRDTRIGGDVRIIASRQTRVPETIRGVIDHASGHLLLPQHRADHPHLNLV